MNPSTKKRKTGRQVTQVHQYINVQKIQKSYNSQMTCKLVLKDIIQRSQQLMLRKQHINRLIQQQKLKQSQQFSINNCGQVLQNFFIQHQCLSPKMNNQINFISPSKSPYSFLNYDQLNQQTQRSSILQVKRQPWEKRRDSQKIRNCNKIYIIKRNNHIKRDSSDKHSTFDKHSSIDRNSSTIKSIKLNDTMPSGFSTRLSHKPQIKKLSLNNNSFIPRLSSRGRLTTNPFSSIVVDDNKHKYLQIQNNSTINNNNNRSSFYEQKNKQKQLNQNNHNKLIKLENKLTDQANINTKIKIKPIQIQQKQTNDYITFLRQRKQKLQNIMKSFDLDDMLKKNHKIQRQNLMRDSKTENLAQTYCKIPSLTTDYQGNLLYVNQPKISNNQISNQSKSIKKLYPKLPKYQPHIEGALSHNVAFKIKDLDDKTTNFLNQIFSSARGTPTKSTKKIAFNTNNLDINRKNHQRKTDKNLSSKISLVYQEKKYDDDRNNYYCQPSIKGVQTINNSKILRSNFDTNKNQKQMLKIPLKSIRKIIQHSFHEQDKKNIPTDINSQNIKQVDIKSNKGKGILKSQPSYRQNKNQQQSLRQLQKLCRDGYAMKKQRIHPNLSKLKKVTTIETEDFQKNKIIEVSNQNSQRNQQQTEHQPLKGFFDMLLSKALK